MSKNPAAMDGDRPAFESNVDVASSENALAVPPAFKAGLWAGKESMNINSFGITRAEVKRWQLESILLWRLWRRSLKVKALRYRYC